jgi:ubiquinone/menaquinone biosynthesis C-methylase UbiE
MGPTRRSVGKIKPQPLSSCSTPKQCIRRGAKILEAGCGVGAQTVTLAPRSPKAHFTAIDTSAESLAKARQVVAAAGLSNVTLEEADILDLPPVLCA